MTYLNENYPQAKTASQLHFFTPLATDKVLALRAHERGYSDTRHCQNFSSDIQHWGQKMPDTRHSKFTTTLDT